VNTYTEDRQHKYNTGVTQPSSDGNTIKPAQGSSFMTQYDEQAMNLDI